MANGLNLPWLSTLSTVIGWGYFLAWSISFYPQAYMNYKRKSVVGLSFDFLALNITGWICYSMFNCLIFWEPTIQAEYLARLGPPIPVNPNDVFFGLHAFVLTIVTIIQCCIYERGGQKVSKIVIGIICLVIVATFIQLFVCIAKIESWLDYMFYFSYVKVGITLLKYIPQAYANYRRQSTEGWSIGNILLDMTGGVLSFLQIYLDATNTGNTNVLEGGGAKLGLSIISLAFDYLFIIQHYCLYRKYSSIGEDVYILGKS